MMEIYTALNDTLIPAFLDHKIGINTHGNVLNPCNGKAIPLQALTGPEVSRDNRHIKVARLSALCTSRLYS
jgi:hypothetical protein